MLMTYGTESFDKNVPNVEPPFKREYFKKCHQRVANIVEIKSSRISPIRFFQCLLQCITYRLYFIFSL